MWLYQLHEHHLGYYNFDENHWELKSLLYCWKYFLEVVRKGSLRLESTWVLAKI